MSVLQSAMYSNQLQSPFAAGARHSRTLSLSEFLAQIKPQIAARKMRSASPAAYQLPELQTRRKRRTNSDGTNEYAKSPNSPEIPALKRSRTAPSSPIDSKFSLESHTSVEKVTLPSISDALAGVSRHVLKALAPTVSLDYFDTYKPNDANWRYGLIDLIRHTKPAFSLERYAYLNTHAKMLPLIHELVKPHFDSRISKTLPTVPARKVNFPYESNYTYLNKTYLHDVKKFPEYLELAQLLMKLSQREPVVEQAKCGNSDNFSSNLVRAESSSHQQATPSPQSVSYKSVSHPHVLSPSNDVHSATFTTPKQSFARPHAELATRFIPITPPSVKDKSRAELMRSPPRAPGVPRVCISCGLHQSPCWRPSWSTKEGQLCNSCGLRYKKTAARCLNMECKKIPAKGEWALMQSKGKSTFEDGERAYGCLSCGCKTILQQVRVTMAPGFDVDSLKPFIPLSSEFEPHPPLQQEERLERLSQLEAIYDVTESSLSTHWLDSFTALPISMDDYNQFPLEKRLALENAYNSRFPPESAFHSSRGSFEVSRRAVYRHTSRAPPTGRPTSRLPGLNGYPNVRGRTSR